MTTPLSVFGATVNYSTASDPVLQIPYSAIKVASNWGTPPTSSGTQDLDQWLVGMLTTLTLWNSQQTTEAHDVVISETFRGVASRNNIDQRPTINYSIAIYNKTPTIIEPDADDVA
jgi:hypothetical protein